MLYPHGMLILLPCPNRLIFVSMSARQRPNLQKYAVYPISRGRSVNFGAIEFHPHEEDN
jgi:hypothetical protein